MLQKILSGNDSRKSRFHDRHGHLIPPALILKNFPRALLSALRLKATGKRAVRPWISYTAANLLESELATRPCDVLEFGSGMSTLWFAPRANRLCSIENDPRWYAEVQLALTNLGSKKESVEYQLAESADAYTQFKLSTCDMFDIILVDGPWRADCLLHHMQKIRNGGLIYVDNTDAESSSGDSGEITLAVERLRQFALQRGASIERFTDFVPGCVFASEGLLLRMPKV